MMNRILAISVFAATSAGTAWAAECAPGVDCTPLNVGGIQYEVTVPGFEMPMQGFGQGTSDGYVVQAKSAPPAGCFVLTPWLLVGHADGRGEVIPVIKGKWGGVIYPSNPQEPGIVNLVIEIKRSGIFSTQADAYSTAQLISKRLVYNFPDGGKMYMGDYNNALNMFRPYLLGFQVKEDDEIRVKVCDLAGLSSLTVHSIVLRTFPL